MVDQRFRDLVLSELKKAFRPEFLNRVDEIIVFHNLTMEHIKQIVDLQMQDVAKRLQEQGLSLELTRVAREWLAEKGYDPAWGARPLRRLITRCVENPLSKKLLDGEFKRGDTVVIEVEGEELVFRRKEPRRTRAKTQQAEVAA